MGACRWQRRCLKSLGLQMRNFSKGSQKQAKLSLRVTTGDWRWIPSQHSSEDPHGTGHRNHHRIPLSVAGRDGQWLDVCLKMVEGPHGVSLRQGRRVEEENRNNFPIIQSVNCLHFLATRFLPLNSSRAEAAPGASGLLKAEGGKLNHLQHLLPSPLTPLLPRTKRVPPYLLYNKTPLPSALSPVKQISLEGLALIVIPLSQTPQKPKSQLFPLMAPFLPSHLLPLRQTY